MREVADTLAFLSGDRAKYGDGGLDVVFRLLPEDVADPGPAPTGGRPLLLPVRGVFPPPAPGAGGTVPGWWP